MLRKARGGIGEFCLEVVCLPRIHPNDPKAGRTPFCGNETYRGYLKSEKFEGLRVAEQHGKKFPKENFEKCLGIHGHSHSFLDVGGKHWTSFQWINEIFSTKDNVNNVTKESSLSTWEDSECVSSSLYRQCCYFGTQQINFFWSQSSHFKAERL